MSVWQNVQSAGLPQRHALGLWLNHRKLISSAYVPSAQSRQTLRGTLPFWYVFDFNLAARQTTELRAVTSKNFYLLVMLGNPGIGTTFRAQIFDGKRKKRFGDRGENDANLVGIASLPFFLREPYQFNALSPILVRVQNVSNAANVGQIVLYGRVD